MSVVPGVGQKLPSELQSHLLRVLDGGGEYHRLGEAKARRTASELMDRVVRPPRRRRKLRF